MNDTEKIVAAIFAMGFCAIKADRSRVTEIVFVEVYDTVLKEIKKREAEAAIAGAVTGH